MRVLLWGAGAFGKRFLKHIPNEMVEGFIDSDTNKQGTLVGNKKVYSFDDYLTEFRDCYIVITHLQSENALNIIKKNGVIRFFMCNDCPAEWIEESNRQEYEEYVDNVLKKADEFSLLGLNFFSIVICEKVHRLFGAKINIYYENEHAQLADELKNDYKYCEFLPINRFDICKHAITYNATTKDIKDEKIININNCYKYIPEYRNERFEELKDKHKGKRIFILGLGPSLNVEDIEKLDACNEITISMNEIYYIFEQTNWRPDYYVISDTLSIRNGIENYTQYEMGHFIIGDTCGKDIEKCLQEKLGEKFFRLHEYRDWSITRLPEYSSNLVDGAVACGSVTYTCIQLATYLGANEIYLLGMDNSVRKKDGQRYGHFYKEERYNAQNFRGYVGRAYEKAKKYASDNDIHIYNASRGGELESFERVDFDSLF